MKSFTYRRLLGQLAIAAALALGTGAPGLHAETRTLTDKQGRSLKADVISVEEGKVTIRRDDGHTFTLSLDTLSEDDQKSLKEWAAKQAKLIPAGSVEVQVSRGKFDTKKKDDGGGIIMSEEQWGYTATLFNRANMPLNGARVAYILFVKPDAEPGKDTTSAPLKQKPGSKTIDALAPHESINFRTDSIPIYKQQLKPGYIWGKTGTNTAIKDSLYGIWMRVYVGDQMVEEVVNPESLSKTEKWTVK
jgi:hypothetical protein